MRRPDGFPNEVLLILSQKDLARVQGGPLTKGLYATDLGFFPKAEGHYRNRPGGCDQHIVLLCLEGSGRYRVADGPVFPVGPGDVFLVPQGYAHEYSADDQDPWTLQWVHVRGSLADSLVVLWGNDFAPKPLSSPVLARARDHFSDLLTLASREGALRAFSGALDWWLRLVLCDPPLSPLPGISAPPVIEQAVHYMAEHLDEPLTLAVLAAQVHLSPSRFAAVFFKQTGNAPMAHFQRLRIQRARSLLERKGMTISEVALAVGYQDPLYFSRLFRKATGLSPRAWIKNPRG